MSHAWLRNGCQRACHWWRPQQERIPRCVTIKATSHTRSSLCDRGFQVDGEFTCRGHDTDTSWHIFGGFAKGRFDLDYGRIAHGDRYTIITSGSHPEGVPLPTEKFVEMLKATIPDQMPPKHLVPEEDRERPVSVSRGWKKQPETYTGKLVTKTALPLPHQMEVAKQPGATSRVVEDRWTSPADDDPAEWGEKCAFELKLREVLVSVAMKQHPRRMRDIWEGKWPLTEMFAEMQKRRQLSPSTA